MRRLPTSPSRPPSPRPEDVADESLAAYLAVGDFDRSRTRRGPTGRPIPTGGPGRRDLATRGFVWPLRSAGDLGHRAPRSVKSDAPTAGLTRAARRRDSGRRSLGRTGDGPRRLGPRTHAPREPRS